KILDRRKAIKKALSLAKENDIVLITGKGSEQAICAADGEKIKWDDRAVVREEIERLGDKK
ncbi:UDP-N-acetylmuramoyl-L-alanyl-D-glutamate--2,6-diaminopimelate ligase, partial [Candidatus Parcubacteria bacterium]|nr:UDP-N-acetylmuramoyl-L-alanyl-D-glutamate--2,6-diaminopimelate ligase [Candidatus Parcubacteria bacterium]